MKKSQKEIVIPKEKAVFWLDKNGRWHNQYGVFQHKRIIAYFNACIEKDKNGYYLCQESGKIREKVYFHYEDTALFAVDLIKRKENDIALKLNTQEQIKLKPRCLFIKGDSLYMQTGVETIKFVERGLIKISDLLEFKNEQYWIKVKNKTYKIRQK